MGQCGTEDYREMMRGMEGDGEDGKGERKGTEGIACKSEINKEGMVGAVGDMSGRTNSKVGQRAWWG